MRRIANSFIKKRYLLVDTDTHLNLNCPICGKLKVLPYTWRLICWECLRSFDYISKQSLKGITAYKLLMWTESHCNLACTEVEIPEDFPIRDSSVIG